jgi:thymidine kinase
MAKIHFYYGAMNASKTTLLINNADNYQRSGLKPIVIKPSIDTRENLEGVVVNRRGNTFPATIIDSNDPHAFWEVCREDIVGKADVVLIDEVQFFSVEIMEILRSIVDTYEIPVITGSSAPPTSRLASSSLSILIASMVYSPSQRTVISNDNDPFCVTLKP